MWQQSSHSLKQAQPVALGEIIWITYYQNVCQFMSLLAALLLQAC